IQPEWELDRCALADGGEGFAQILTEAAGGSIRSHLVNGPRGDRVEAAYGRVPLKNIPEPVRDQLQLSAQLSADAPIAVIEMASASGLALLSPGDRDPWLTSTQGTGELMRMAVEAGAGAILLGVG